MKKTLFILLILPFFASAQNGMKFEHGLSWKEVQAKAKAEHKFIFMDAFTTWCGPCRYMSANIFPMENVGAVLNKDFINVKVQLDTSKNDNDEVKKYYADGHEIMTKYHVNVFPTYLFFDPNGKLVHRAVGSSDAEKFIAKAKDAMNPDKQYYVLLEQYLAGKRDPDFLRKTALAAQEAYDPANMKKVSHEYIATQKDLTTKENLEFLDQFTNTTKDEGFAVIMNNQEKFNKVKGEGAAGKKIVQILLQDEVRPKLSSKDGKTPDWEGISVSLNKSYPAYAKEVVSYAKVVYYQGKRDWPNFEPAVVDYMKNFGSKVSPEQLNSFAWTVFENCKDMTCVAEALNWSKRSVDAQYRPMFIDTYANILYKLGKQSEAMEWEAKAAALTSDNKSILETLNKMKKGEKTWTE